MKWIAVAAVTALAQLAAAPGLAQDYPTRPVTIVVPFAAGSGSDTVARMVGQHLGPRLGQNVTIENRVGATGALATAAVARTEPNGYTLLLGTNSTHGSNSALYKRIAYDPVAEFDPVAHTGLFNYVLVANNELPFKSVAELVAYAKAQPGKLTYAGGSSTSIVMAETFARASGIQILKVPYRSNPPALTDVIAGRVGVMFADISSAASFVKAGNLRPLAVTTKVRSQLYPDLPTLDETVAPGFDIVSWTGLIAPAGTPKPIMERLNREVNTVLQLPEVKERLQVLGIELTPMPTDRFAAYVREEVAKWSRLVREAGIEPE